MNDDVWGPSAGARAERSGWWRPNERLALALVVALGVQAVMYVVAAFLDDAKPYERLHAAFQAAQDGHQTLAQQRIDHAFDGSGRVVVQLAGYVAFVVTVLLIVWTYRCAKNASALGRVGARLTPGWTIAGWLVPVANFVLPYLAVSDLWRSSDASAERGSGWRRLHTSSLVVAWWFVYLIGSVGFLLVMAVVLVGRMTAADARADLVVAHLATALGSVLGIFVVRDVTARQAAQQAADPAPLVPDRRGIVDVPRGPDGVPLAGWYPDPGHTFDHRYWDGRAWTEFVSVKGDLATAPVAPSNWYPDPTGRNEWRFWDGYAWTEHVSRGGEPHTDPIGGSAPG